MEPLSDEDMAKLVDLANQPAKLTPNMEQPRRDKISYTCQDGGCGAVYRRKLKSSFPGSVWNRDGRQLFTETDEAFEARAIKLANAANKRAFELKRKSVGRIRSAVNDAFNEDEEARVRRERAKPLIDTGSFRKAFDRQMDQIPTLLEIEADDRASDDFVDAVSWPKSKPHPESCECKGCSRADDARQFVADLGKEKPVELYQPGKRKIKL